VTWPMFSFLLALCYFLLSCIRPFDIPGMALYGKPVLLILGVIAFLSLLVAVMTNEIKLFDNGMDRMVLGLFAAIIFSHAWHAYFAGMIDSAVGFLPTVFSYMLAAHAVRTPKRLRTLLFLLTCCTMFLSWEGARQYHHGVSWLGVEPAIELLDEDIPVEKGAQRSSVVRVKWVGVFDDPNDFAMLLVLPLPYLMHLVVLRKYFLPLVAISSIFMGIAYTNSRSGMLAALVGLGGFLVLQKRSIFGIAVGGVSGLLALLVLAPSRMGDISAGGESAQGRIEAWYEGVQMLRSSPLFGVGEGMFTDYHYLTAHNSFVLVFAELGMVGCFFFTALFYLAMQNGVHWTLGEGRHQLDQDEAALASSLLAGLAGTMTSMFFLSRSYLFLPYLVLGLINSHDRILRQKYSANEPRFSMGGQTLRNIFVAELVGIAIFFVLAKLLLR